MPKAKICKDQQNNEFDELDVLWMNFETKLMLTAVSAPLKAAEAAPNAAASTRKPHLVFAAGFVSLCFQTQGKPLKHARNAVSVSCQKKLSKFESQNGSKQPHRSFSRGEAMQLQSFRR